MKRAILLITPYVPYPLDSGGNQAFFTMVNHLLNDFDISIALSISVKDSGRVEALKKLWPNVTFYIHTKKKRSFIDRLKGGEGSFWRWMHKTSNRKMSRLAREKDVQKGNATLYQSQFSLLSNDFYHFIYETSRKGFDLIQVEFYEYLSLVYLLPPSVTSIFIHHELRYIRNECEFQLFKERKYSDSLLLHVAKEYEVGTLARYNYIFTLSDVDAAYLKKEIVGKTQIKVSPAAIVREETEESIAFSPNRTNRLVFLGSQNHFPNFDAMMWFCNEIAPLLRARNFNFTLDVIGQWNPKELLKQIPNTPELRFLGYVDDLNRCMEGTIMVVPIRIGSGMRIKILDAIASYVPFITTTKGTEGIDMRHHEECLIAETPEEYAKAVVELCGNPSLQQQLATNAFKRLQSIYVPQQMIELRKMLYNEMIEAKESC